MNEPKEHLNKDDIAEGTKKGLKKYESLNFLEKFAMYMGVAQIMELRFKQILVRDFGADFDKIENLPLGPVFEKLRKEGMREEIFLFAEPVKESRNYIAHEMIANEFLIRSLVDVDPDHYSKSERTLDKSIYELEQLMFILEFNEEHGTWK